jgi:hypothetical protein
MPASNRRQTVAFTAVPRGFVNGGAAPALQVAVHISPRLSYAGDGGTLASFPDWVSWPSRAITWQVGLHNATLTPTVVSAPPDPAFWEALFRPTLRVDSFTGDPGPARTVRGYSYETLASYLKDAYTDPSGFSRSEFAATTPSILDMGRWEAGTDQAAALGPALAQYLGFWSPPPGDDTLESGELDTDFHDRLSLVGDHTPLLEKLGLVVVLQFPTITAPRETAVKVTGTFAASPDVSTTLVSPKTRAIFDPANRIFVSQRRSTTAGEHTERLHLDVANPAFSVHSLNVDAAVAGNLGVAVGDSSDTGVAPTSGGIVLAVTGRMRRMQTDLTNAEETAAGTVANPANPPDRYAEDLIVGHHIEIGVGPDQYWFGLGHRQVRYLVDRPGQTPLRFTAIDEAPVTAVGRQAEANDPSQLLISDVIMRWDGWSLGIPRPGKLLLQADPTNASVDDAPGRPEDAPLTLETTKTDVSAEGEEGRLPPLRYGQLYSVRGRAVDVTGGAPSWEGAAATAIAPYLRFDPAPTPLVLPPPSTSLTRGESARMVVVRSNPRSGELPTVKSSRTLAPPRSTIDTALLHGWLDNPDTKAPDADKYALFARLDGAEVRHEGPTPDGPTREPVALVVDWLPDPFSTHTRIGLLDPTGEEVDHRFVSFVPPGTESDSGLAQLGSWQSAALLVEGVSVGAFPTMAQSEQVTPQQIVTIGLPPAASARVALRPSPREQVLALHGLVDWDAPYTFEETVQRVRDGLLPQLTPTTYVDMVHAVRQPLVDPAFEDLEDAATRGAGEKDVTLAVPLTVHADSTSRVTVYASWVEQVDAGPQLVTAGITKPTTRTVPLTRVVESSIDLDHAGEASSIVVQGLVPLPDLRRVDITLTAVATSRFVPEFREVLTIPGTGTLPPGVDRESVAVLFKTSPLVLGTDYRFVADGAGWKVVLLNGMSLTDDDLFVEGVKGTVLATSAPSVPVIVRSAVRPEPPKVLYAIPAFAVAEPERDDNGALHAGRGANRLRLYLERPWWTSGTGEQLAVIVNTGTNLSSDPQGTSAAAKLVTLYGADPALTPGGYPLHKQDLISGTLVAGTLDEPGTSATYTARAHPVLYDAERDLYYTEIQLRPQLAGTFVRLAVARYQPYVTDQVSNLSRIVTMDPVQLLPPRELTVKRRKNSHYDKIVVDVSGSVHKGPFEAVPPFLKVSIQTKTVRGASEDLGWDTVILTTAKRLANGNGYKTLVLDVPPGTPSTARVLVEELETWISEGEIRGELAEPWVPGKQPKTFDEARLHLQARRITWVATTPLPR